MPRGMWALEKPRAPRALRRLQRQDRPITKPAPVDRDWEAIARDYAANVLSTEEICQLHSIGRSTLYNRALKERWPTRVAMVDGHSRRRGRERDLGQRLLDLVDRKMAQIEKRLAAEIARTRVRRQRW